MKGVAKDSNSRMIKIINRLADSGFARVGFREVTPCELWNMVVDNHIVEVYGLDNNSDNREMLMDFLQRNE